MNPENCDIKQKAAPEERPRVGMSEEPEQIRKALWRRGCPRSP